jgi:hypothetical protein
MEPRHTAAMLRWPVRLEHVSITYASLYDHGRHSPRTVASLISDLEPHRRTLKTIAIGEQGCPCKAYHLDHADMPEEWMSRANTLQDLDLSGFEALEELSLPQHVIGLDRPTQEVSAIEHDDQNAGQTDLRLSQPSASPARDYVENLLSAPRLRHLTWIIPQKRGTLLGEEPQIGYQEIDWIHGLAAAAAAKRGEVFTPDGRSAPFVITVRLLAKSLMGRFKMCPSTSEVAPEEVEESSLYTYSLTALHEMLRPLGVELRWYFDNTMR